MSKRKSWLEQYGVDDEEIKDDVVSEEEDLTDTERERKEKGAADSMDILEDDEMPHEEPDGDECELHEGDEDEELPIEEEDEEAKELGEAEEDDFEYSFEDGDDDEEAEKEEEEPLEEDDHEVNLDPDEEAKRHAKEDADRAIFKEEDEEDVEVIPDEEEKDELHEDADTDTGAQKASEVEKDRKKLDIDSGEAEKVEDPNLKLTKIDMSEATKLLFKGKNLSESFQNRARVLMESAVNRKIRVYQQKLQESYTKQLTSSKNKFRKSILEKMDVYCDHAVKEWLKENRIAIVNSSTVSLAEGFLKGMTKMYRENYISVPAGKRTAMQRLQKENNDLKKKLNESVDRNIKNTKVLNEIARKQCVAAVLRDLPDTKKEKFKTLSEDLAFRDKASFQKKLVVLKEELFAGKKAKPRSASPTAVSPAERDSQMGAYLAGASVLAPDKE